MSITGVLSFSSFYFSCWSFWHFSLRSIKRILSGTRSFYPLIAYLAFALLSAICSINRKAAFLGNLSEQGFFVLAGYVLIAYYTYQTIREEGDYTSIFHAILVMFVPLSLIGWLQVFKMIHLDGTGCSIF